MPNELTGAISGLEDTKTDCRSQTTLNGNAAAISGTPTPGVYRVEVQLLVSGTAETQGTNLRLRANSVVVGSIPTLPGERSMVWPRVTLTGGTFDVNTAAVATTGAIYTCQLRVTRIE